MTTSEDGAKDPRDAALAGSAADLTRLSGSDLTIAFLAAYPEREIVIPVLGSGLAEPAIRARALRLLLLAPEPRAPREIVRGFHHLSADERRSVLLSQREPLLAAAHQLLDSGKFETRANVAEVAHCVVELAPEHLGAVMPILLVLFDDPRQEVARRARQAFIAAVLGVKCAATRNVGANHPVLRGLSLLLDRFASHKDPQLARALFAVGPFGADLLGRAIGQNSPAVDSIRAVCDEVTDEEQVLETRIEGMFRWLESPTLATREAARTILRARGDPAFLRAICHRVARLETSSDARDYPIYRHLRWDQVPAEELRALSPATLVRVAGYLSATGEDAHDSAQRVARLLGAATGESRLALLRMLRELPADPILAALEPLLDQDDEQVQLLALELVSASNERHASILLVKRLRSRFESVREFAQRKLTGRSLAIYFDAFQALAEKALGEEERRRILQALRKVDGSFTAQLRRSLRAPDEESVIRALRTVCDLEDAAEFADSLLDLAVSPSARVRATLARALRGVPAEPRQHFLRLFLSDPDERVVANAVETFGEVRESRALPWLAELNGHPSARVRVNALLALALQGSLEAVQKLERMAGEAAGVPRDRASALWGLKEYRRLTTAGATGGKVDVA